MEYKFEIGDVVLYTGFRTVFHDIPFVVMDSYTVFWNGDGDRPAETRIECQVLFGDTKRFFYQELLQIFKPDE